MVYILLKRLGNHSSEISYVAFGRADKALTYTLPVSGRFQRQETLASSKRRLLLPTRQKGPTHVLSLTSPSPASPHHPLPAPLPVESLQELA